MPTLQVRDFPEDLYEKLRIRASNEHRSISQQTIVAIRDYLADDPKTPTRKPIEPIAQGSYLERHRKAFEEIDALPAVDVPDDFPNPEEIVREIRNSR